MTAVFGTLTLVVVLSLNGTFYYKQLQNDTSGSRHQLRVLPHVQNHPVEKLRRNLEEEASPNNATLLQNNPTEEATHPNNTINNQNNPTEKDTHPNSTINDKSNSIKEVRHPINSPTYNQNNITEQVTDPSHTKFVVLNRETEYRQGDVLTAVIVARDVRGRPKTYGGDFFRAKLVSIRPGEASCAGHVTDHGNGTYTVQFPLYWAGDVNVCVQLVHPSETVRVLRRVRDVPAKRGYECIFFETETGPKEERQCFTSQPPGRPLEQLCDLSRKEANGTWFCVKPDALPCSAIAGCRRDVTQKGSQSPYIEAELEQDIQTPIHVKESARAPLDDLPDCSSNTPGVLFHGYWSGNVWKSSVCRVRMFTRADARSCLANKTLYIQGDSTIRQWYLWLAAGHSKGSLKPGPAIAINKDVNIVVHYRSHGLPLMGSHWMNFTQIRYVVDELDSMNGGPNTVIVLGLWAHFTTESLEMFRARLHAIQNAIHRLLQRSPGTRVFVRTGTTREHKDRSFYLRGSDWLAYQITEEIRQIFRTDRDVVVLDTWDMSVCQWEPDNIHPGPALIDSQINMLLSHICPK
ncbi:PREDICTED: NXPE family member 3-like [Branchiostoma belcheri]|uniref:NXPE family member 3-like n=1 Tax=Branchiostoma belcheri TaxID=7741 RepID=A0A6P5AFA9_BRABE|nr:PREDICTED: NXPE family member 3-like [Branchiostoma belcheri]